MEAQASVSSVPPSPVPLRPRRPTSRQVEAVYSVMRLLRNDRPSGGPENQIWCAACRRGQDRSGSASYGDYILCNGCATEYELLRLGGSVDRVEDFLPSASSG